MAKIQCKLSDLQKSQYECDRIGYQNFIQMHGDTDEYRIINTEEFNFLDFGEFFDQQGHFIIDIKIGLPMSLYISILGKDGIHYDEENKVFCLRYVLRRGLSTEVGSLGFLNIEFGEIEILEIDFCNALLFCAYIDKRIDIIQHPAISDKLQNVINNHIKDSEKHNRCRSYKIMQSSVEMKKQDRNMRILFVDETVKNDPEILGFFKTFELSKFENTVSIRINEQDAATLKTGSNMSVYIVDENNNLCFRLMQNCNISCRKGIVHDAIVSFNAKSILFDEDIDDYFENEIKPKIKVYNATSTAERVSITFMDDLFDW